MVHRCINVPIKIKRKRIFFFLIYIFNRIEYVWYNLFHIDFVGTNYYSQITMFASAYSAKCEKHTCQTRDFVACEFHIYFIWCAVSCVISSVKKKRTFENRMNKFWVGTIEWEIVQFIKVNMQSLSLKKTDDTQQTKGKKVLYRKYRDD